MTLTLRDATLDDLALLKRWSDMPHVLAASNDDWGWAQELARKPAWREQLIAELDGRPIGFMQIIVPALEDSHYWGDCPTNLRPGSGAEQSCADGRSLQRFGNDASLFGRF